MRPQVGENCVKDTKEEEEEEEHPMKRGGAYTPKSPFEVSKNKGNKIGI